MVYDLQNQSGGVDQIDFEECLQEFMLDQFNVEGDDESIEQIAKIMMKVRVELTKSAVESQTLYSPELDKLRKFNEEQKLKQPLLNKHIQD